MDIVRLDTWCILRGIEVYVWIDFRWIALDGLDDLELRISICIEGNLLRVLRSIMRKTF